MRSGARARTAAPKVTRPIAQTASMRFIEPPSGDAGADELLDSIDDVFDVELRRIDPLGVLGGLHARGVTLVAKPEVGGKRVAADVGPLELPALGADVRIGVEVDLHAGVRRDDRADVAALDHGVAEVGELALPAAHDEAHFGVPRDDRDEAVDLRLTYRFGDVVARDRDRPVLVQVDRVVVGELTQSQPLLEIEGTLDREPGDGPVHGARVQIPEPETLGEPARDGALSGSGGPVDRNDHRWVTESSRSKKSGKLTATLSAPSMPAPSRETRPAMAPSMAIR